MGISFEDVSGDVAIVTFSGTYTDAEFDAYLDVLTVRLTTAQIRGFVFDARNSRTPSALQARRQGAWMKNHRQRLLRYTAGTAFVFESAALRFALSSIFLVQKPPCPYLVTPSLDEALRWARQHVKDRVRLTAAVP